MQLTFDEKLIEGYKSASQKVRVLTEHWVNESVYCPNCGHLDIDQYENNRPVADFYCKNCSEDYELKSKQKSVGTKIVDGAHRTMVERLASSSNPNLFLLNYDLLNLEVTNFFVIPKHFFVPEIIEKRNPLAPTARRAGWVGCNILLNYIPQKGKIFFVRNRQIEPKEKVLDEWNKTLFLRDEKKVSAKGWLLDVMRCIDKLGKLEFTISNVYAFENELSKLHPENRHIKDKIRQQLQFLRDKGYLHFVSRGCYRLA
jgi:type II restriction enzyme